MNSIGHMLKFSALSGAIVCLGAIVGCSREASAKDSANIAAPVDGKTALLVGSNGSIADVAERVTPSVVNIFTEKAKPQADRVDQSPYFSDPFFRHFFGDQRGQPFEAPARREQSLGSGVIISSDGIILTNNHVVANADKIRVALRDNRILEAKLVGADAKSDVAVLRVTASDLPAISVADSSKMRIGDIVLAIGNPFGLGQTVTMGIISAVGRANMGLTDYEDFLQTDAAINPGNSGGALVNMAGELVGINTAIVSRSGGYQGIGFAIPTNMAMNIKSAILKDGKVTRGWLGVAIQDLNEELAKDLDLKVRSGVLISDVTADGPASKAGIQRGDVVTSIDGTKTTDSAHLRNLVAFAGKGKTVRVEIQRDGKAKTFDVVLGELPGDGSVASSPKQLGQDSVFAGVSVQDIDAADRSRMRIPPNVKGVLVSRIDEESQLAASGLRPGDIILEVNRRPTPSVEAFQKVAQGASRRALLLVYRDGMTLFMSVSR